MAELTPCGGAVWCRVNNETSEQLICTQHSLFRGIDTKPITGLCEISLRWRKQNIRKDCGVVCGVWCVVCGVWCVVCDVWCGVVWCGVWCGVV